MRKIYKDNIGFTKINILSAVLVLIIIGLVVFLVVNHGDKKKPTVTANSTTTSSSGLSTSSCAVYTQISKVPSSWQTYTSSKYGFNISYPSSWKLAPTGGSVDNLTILDGLLFTPPGQQGSQYDVYVTKQTLASAVTNWENGVKAATNNSGLAGGPKEQVLSNTCYKYDGYQAAKIYTEQSSGTGSNATYDVEFDISANSYLYDFSTGYQSIANPLSISSNPETNIGLTVFESLHVK